MFRAGRASTEAWTTGPLAPPVPALLVVPLPFDSRSVPSGQLPLAGLPAPSNARKGMGPPDLPDRARPPLHLGVLLLPAASGRSPAPPGGVRRDTEGMARRTPPDRPLIFISHFSAEQEIALKLQELLDRAFLGQVNIFVSSDDRSIRMGADFNGTIQDALRATRYGLLILSPAALRRPWVNIEFGALWVQNKPVTPICHSGLSPAQLPPPYVNHNGLSATDVRALNKLVANLAQEVEMRAPTVDWQPFLDVVQAAEQAARHRDLDTVAGAVATLTRACGQPEFPQQLRAGGHQYTLGDHEQGAHAALAVLRDHGLVEQRFQHRTQGPAGPGKTYELSGTAAYGELWLDPAFPGLLGQALGRPVPTLLEVSSGDAGQVREDHHLERVRPGAPAATAQRPDEPEELRLLEAAVRDAWEALSHYRSDPPVNTAPLRRQGQTLRERLHAAEGARPGFTAAIGGSAGREQMWSDLAQMTAVQPAVERLGELVEDLRARLRLPLNEARPAVVPRDDRG